MEDSSYLSEKSDCSQRCWSVLVVPKNRSALQMPGDKEGSNLSLTHHLKKANLKKLEFVHAFQPVALLVLSLLNSAMFYLNIIL